MPDYPRALPVLIGHPTAAALQIHETHGSEKSIKPNWICLCEVTVELTKIGLPMAVTFVRFAIFFMELRRWSIADLESGEELRPGYWSIWKIIYSWRDTRFKCDLQGGSTTRLSGSFPPA
jgi:hypothetical protein